MKFLILTLKQDLESIQQLTKMIQGSNTEYNILNPFEMDHDRFLQNKYDVILNRVSGISYNDDDLELLKEYQVKWPHSLIVNTPQESMIFRDKYKQFEQFTKNNIPTIPTLNLEAAKIEEVEFFVEKQNSSKYLLKPIRSNQAKGIIVTDKPILEFEHLNKSRDTRYILQPLIEKKCEWRALAINGELIGTLYKHCDNPEELLNCEKAKLSYIQNAAIPKHISELINKAINSNDLYIQAMDILEQNDGEALLIEINSIPGFKYFEKTTGISPANKLIQRIFKHLRS